MPTHEKEITAPVDLCTPDGRLNPAAVGWSRTPLHRCNLRGWGRTKRWEYWCVTTPTHLVALTVSSLDYLALTSVYLLDYGPHRSTPRETSVTALSPLARGVRLSRDLDAAETLATGRINARITPDHGATRLRFDCRTPHGPLTADLTAVLPAGHETLSVVVPWDDRRFQYTSKHTARPAHGTVRLGETVYDFTDAWAVLDHGRGRWPYSTHWHWGAASGRTDGHTVGLQLGGTWTRGTGMTENAVCVDGRLTKIGTELRWHHPDNSRPWHLSTPDSDQVDLVFTPFHERVDSTDAVLLRNHTRQCFGHYSGTVRTDDGAPIRVDRLLGWAEEVRMRW